jgi:membrane protease YdiL (CAAX protease family)
MRRGRDIQGLLSPVAYGLAKLTRHWWGWAFLFVGMYVLSMYATAGVMALLNVVGLIDVMDATSYAFTVRMLMYALLVTLVIILPRWLGQRMSRQQVGVDRLLEWKDFAFGGAGVAAYLLLAMGALALLALIPGVDISQAQDLEVGQVYGAARVGAFIVFVVLTPLFEELVFRGALYGGLRMRRLSPWASALLVSVLFGLAHGQLNVAVDTFCLSLVACYLRELTGSIWAGTLLHIIKNLIAFTIVFVVNQL